MRTRPPRAGELLALAGAVCVIVATFLPWYQRAAGRLVVRASGTEPVLRITVEARDDATAKRIVESLAAEAMEALA